MIHTYILLIIKRGNFVALSSVAFVITMTIKLISIV